MIINDSTNINSTNNNLSPQTIKHKNYHDIWRWKSRFYFGQYSNVCNQYLHLNNRDCTSNFYKNLVVIYMSLRLFILLILVELMTFTITFTINLYCFISFYSINLYYIIYFRLRSYNTKNALGTNGYHGVCIFWNTPHITMSGKHRRIVRKGIPGFVQQNS